VLHVKKNIDIINIVELRKFFGIHMILGINKVSNYQYLLNIKKNYSFNKQIADFMTCDRFQEINAHLTIVSAMDISTTKILNPRRLLHA
jgi:phage anti-repressor protein